MPPGKSGKTKRLAAQATPAAIKTQRSATRRALVKQFIESVIFSQYRQLVAWRTVTGQSSQLDSGYLAQQLVSLLTGVPGRGHRGKGADLEDGSEVKAASTVSGIDIPRWNNQIGDAKKRKEYLAHPAIFFVLFDTKAKDKSFPLRVRIWQVLPRKDKAFRAVVKKWAEKPSSGNFELHPPCWDDGNIATNNAGNLSLPLMFYAEQKEIGQIDYMEIKRIRQSPGLCKRVDG